MANAIRRCFAPGKALWTVLVGALWCSIALLGCTSGGEIGGGGYPDRSYETFRQLDREVIKLGMTEADVVRILGLPDWRMELPNHDGRALSLTYGFDPPREMGMYVVHLTDGRVVEKFFIWGY